MAGALCIAQAPILHPEDTPEGLQSLLWLPNHLGLYLGYILIQLGLLGIGVRQLQQAGRLGIVGAIPPAIRALRVPIVEALRAT